MIVTSCCYIFKDHQVLLLHRVKKENDINEGKWIGVGGKLQNESIEECLLREVKEETSLILNSYQLKGIILFPNMYHGEDELMYLYTSNDFSGVLTENCNEGILEWIDLDQVTQLNMWEGDHHFFDWFKDDCLHFACIKYEGDQVTEYQHIKSQR